MTTCYLDANVLVYFVDTDGLFHLESVELVESFGSKGIKPIISTLVLDEFLYAIRFLVGANNLGRFRAMEVLLSKVFVINDVGLVNPSTDFFDQLSVVGYMEEFGLKPRDAYHLMTMVENGVEYFATFDNDFDGVFEAGLVSRAR